MFCFYEANDATSITTNKFVSTVGTGVAVPNRASTLNNQFFLMCPLSATPIYQTIYFFVDKDKYYNVRYEWNGHSGWTSSQYSKQNGGGVAYFTNISVY